MRENPRPEETGTVEGLLGSVVLLTVVACALIPVRQSVGLVSVTALLFLVVMSIGLWSTWIASAFVLIASGAVLNACFMQPYGTLKIRAAEDLAGFVAYMATGVVGIVIVHKWKVSRLTFEQVREQALVESERADRGEQRLTWLNHISHDVRTPLSTIRAVVEDMHDEIEYDAATRRELLDIAVEEIDRLDRLIGNWLLLGSIDQQPEPSDHVSVDVGEVVADSIRRLTPLIKSRDVRLISEPDIDPVNGSFTELHHLVTNLLTNAIRYSPEDQPIRVMVLQSDDDVVLEVHDSGPGFKENDNHLLFRPFVVGPESRSTGLGLSICAEVVKRHGGEIALHTTTSGGLVRVRIPRRASRKTV